jgi:hypothetical protein
MKPAAPNGRRQQRLADLHRAVSRAVQSLHQHQVVVVTTWRSDDVAIQQSVLEEHRARVAAVTQALTTLDTFVARCRATVPDAVDAVMLRVS